MLDSNLSERLDLWGFERGVMVFRDQSLGAALNLRQLELTVATDDRINEVKSLTKTFLNGLPQGMTVQFVQELVSGNNEKIEAHAATLETSATDLTLEITKERIQKFKDLDKSGAIPKRNLYVFIKAPFRTKSSSSNIFRLKPKETVLTEAALAREIEQFESTLQSAMDGLKSVGISCEKLSDSDVFRLAYDQWNPGQEPSNFTDSITDVRDRICLTDCVIGPDHFLLGQTYHKVISLKNLPEMTFASMAEALSGLPFDSKLHLTIEVLDQEKERSSLQAQRRLAYATSMGKKGAADLEAQAKLRDIESMLEEMIQGSEKVFRFSLNVLLRSSDLYQLESQTSETLALIRGLSGAEGMIETVAAFNIFTEFAIPQVCVKERAIKVNTSVLADFMPIYGDWSGHEVPQILLRNRSGELLGFDPFSPTLTNSNQIVSGGSGSGKSFLCNLILSQMLKSRPKVFILDIGASYKRFCENLGGQYVSLGLTSGLSINPLSTSGIDPNDREALDQKIKLVASLVEIMTKEHGSGLGRLVKSELEKCIQDLVLSGKEHQLSDLKENLLAHAEPEIVRLGKVLALWCGDSPYGKFVDRPTTVRLESDIVCFDLKELETHPDLQSVCLFLITDLIWRTVQSDRTQMKFTIFDECWKLLESEEGAQFIGSVFRTFRKYRASAIAISQTMDDFSKSKIAPAVMPNSSVKWILKQKGADQQSLKTSLQLNEREMELIASLTSEKGRFSESFLIAEDKRSVVRIESTPLEYWLATTEPKDLTLMNEVRHREGFSDQIELLRFLAKKFPRGAMPSK